MFSPVDKYRLASDAYAFIKKNPMCSKADLNREFRATSNDARLQQLSEALLSLHAHGYILQHTNDVGSVLFWTADDAGASPYDPDRVKISTVELDNAVDIFGRPPSLDAPPPTPTPKPGDLPLSRKEEELQAYLDKAHGMNHKILEVFVRQPFKVFPKNAPELLAVEPDHHKLSMLLGKIWAQKGSILRRAYDPTVKLPNKVAFYTILGTFSEGLTENLHDKLSTPAAKKKALEKAEEERKQKNLQAVVEQQTETREEIEEYPDGSEPQVEDEVERDEGESEQAMQPRAFVDDEMNFMFVRSNGESDQFDEQESAALRQLLLNINIERLKEAQEAWKQSDSQ